MLKLCKHFLPFSLLLQLKKENELDCRGFAKAARGDIARKGGAIFDYFKDIPRLGYSTRRLRRRL
jgi:hypothetical protein